MERSAGQEDQQGAGVAAATCRDAATWALPPAIDHRHHMPRNPFNTERGTILMRRPRLAVYEDALALLREE